MRISKPRFSPVANVHNGYIGFATNPIMKVDPTGQSPIADFFIDAIYVITFAVAAYLTAGAAIAAGAALFGAEAATEVTLAGVASFAAQSIATAANAVGVVTNALQLTDNVINAKTKHHWLTEDQRSDLNNIATLAGTVAGVAGLGAGVAEAAAKAAQLPENAGYLTRPINWDPPPVDPNNAAPVDANNNAGAVNQGGGDGPVDANNNAGAVNQGGGPVQTLDLDNVINPTVTDTTGTTDATTPNPIQPGGPQAVGSVAPPLVPALNATEPLVNNVFDTPEKTAVNQAEIPPPGPPNVETTGALNQSDGTNLNQPSNNSPPNPEALTEKNL